MCKGNEIEYPAILLVEGKNDFHVIKNLCQRKKIPLRFTIKTVENYEDGEVSGIEEVMKKHTSMGKRSKNRHDWYCGGCRR